MVDPIEESIFPERPVVYATFWARFAASFIDGIVTMVIGYFVGFISGRGLVKGFIVGQIIGWIYFAVQESGSNQATIGKRALDIRVTTMDGMGRITFGQATTRYFSKILSFIILLLGYFMMLWDDKSQTLHDKIAGTLVVVR